MIYHYRTKGVCSQEMRIELNDDHTIKHVEGGMICDTPDRSKLYIPQTPQIFKKKYYFDGVNFAAEHDLDFTEDCQLVEAMGVKINMTPSDYKNIKITTPEDMAIAEAIMNQ